MEVEVAAAAVGGRRFYIDLTNWSAVEKSYRPFLANSGWPPGLTTSTLDISSYVRELEEAYREAAAALREKYNKTAKSLWRMWFRLIAPVPVEVETPTWSWEVKTHLDEVLGGKFAPLSEVKRGVVGVEVKNSVVHVGGSPSVGHTYLYLAGALKNL